MTVTTIEKHQLLLSHLGEEKVIELHRLFGDEKISFAGVLRYIKLSKITKVVNKKKGVSQAARLLGVHRTTIYRQLKKKS